MIFTHLVHQNPQKNAFLLQQDWFLEGFGVPGGCKSILNVKCLHKSHIAELFGLRVFWFLVARVKKKVSKSDFIKNLGGCFSSWIEVLKKWKKYVPNLEFFPRVFFFSNSFAPTPLPSPTHTLPRWWTNV